jgi:hypothetical protein
VTTLHSSLNLTSASNQRRRFDIDAGGRWLVAGDEVSDLSLPMIPWLSD